MILAGKRLLVTGVLTERSLAYPIARQAQELGGEVVLTGFGRGLRLTHYAAESLPRPAEILELDVLQDEHFAALGAALAERWEWVDGIVHSIAFAPADVWTRPFLDVDLDSLDIAMRVSVYSLHRLVGALLPLLERAPGGASVVGLTVSPAARMTPSYAWMSVVKAALDTLVKQLAIQLGGRGIRVNLAACGPVRTLAGRAVPGFDDIAGHYLERAPLGWRVDDYTAAAGTTCFLLSDLAAFTTGESVAADGGMHAVL